MTGRPKAVNTHEYDGLEPEPDSPAYSYSSSQYGGDSDKSETPRSPAADSVSSYSYSNSSAPTPSGYSSRSSVEPTPRETSQVALAGPLRLLAGSTRAFLTAADDTFAWLADARGDPAAPVPAPPRPEVARGGHPRRPRSRQIQQWTGGAGGEAGVTTKLAWKEIGELQAALSENDESLQALSLSLASRDAESQDIVEKGEAALGERREKLRALRDKLDAAPAARAARLEELHAQVHAAAAAVDAARKAVTHGHEAAAEEDRIAWEGAEERAAEFAAECAREEAAAEAAEANGIAILGTLAERLARAEAAIEAR